MGPKETENAKDDFLKEVQSMMNRLIDTRSSDLFREKISRNRQLERPTKETLHSEDEYVRAQGIALAVREGVANVYDNFVRPIDTFSQTVFHDGFVCGAFTLCSDEDRPYPDQIRDQASRFTKARNQLLQEAFVSPGLAQAFMLVGYAIYLQFNGWSMSDHGVPGVYGATLRHPEHGETDVVTAMFHAMTDSMNASVPRDR